MAYDRLSYYNQVKNNHWEWVKYEPKCLYYENPEYSR